MKKLIVLAMLAALAWYGYGKYKAVGATESGTRTEFSSSGGVQEQAQAQAAASPPAESQFTCDGRTHCSQMTSCAEATYFLRHCPNTKMDGNNDGEPCEQQWCN